MVRKEILFGLIIAIFLALLISPFASPWPDGLEKVAENKGFLNKAKVLPLLSSPIPDYTWPGIKNDKIATSVSGAVGTLLVFGLGYGLAEVLRRSKKKEEKGR